MGRHRPRSPPRMTAPNIRVVLCHAHAGLRTGLQHLLDAADGIEVVAAAADGGEGVEAAARLAPDVVLMDLAMPRIDAVAATHRIAATSSCTRVLILTAFPQPSRIRDAIEAGASGYVLKEAAPGALVAAVRAVAEETGRPSRA
jgi:DNA-binding NarL/FixJ family response regulator